MARRFKEARLKKNLKLIDAVKIFGVAQSTISAWESERKEPNFETVKRMAEVYEVSIEYLLGYDSFELLSTKERIPYKSIPLFHSKPVWVKDKGWALVNAADNILLFTDGGYENIDKNTEVYFEPQPYTEVFPTRERSFDEEEIYSQEVVWVEPISTDLKLRDMLRGKYSVKGEYVENTRGNRFHLDSYGSLWLAFKAK